MKQFVLQPFIFKGKPVTTGDVVEIDEDRLSYYTEQGLVGDKKPVVDAPAPVEGEPPAADTAPEKPVKKKGAKK